MFTKTMTVECPDRLADQLDEFIREGWAVDARSAIIEALRRFLDSRRPEVARSQILADVEWGLHGRD